MKSTTVALLGAALLLTAAPSWSATIYGGFEDTIGGDYDYNDLVFSLNGGSLTMIAPGALLFGMPILNGGTNNVGAQNGLPFWNNQSSDGNAYNVGFCIYGGGSCNGGVGLAPGAQYLAANSTSPTGSANNVTFSVDGRVSSTVTLNIAGDHDILGWYDTSNPSSIHWLDQSGPVTGTFTFSPSGNFGLVADNNDGSGTTFYSQTSLGDGNDSTQVSHFGFFVTPEPSTIFLLGSALVAIGSIRRRPAFLRGFGAKK